MGGNWQMTKMRDNGVKQKSVQFGVAENHCSVKTKSRDYQIKKIQ